MPNDRHLFVIPPEVRKALSPSEIDATVAALKQAGLFRLPYPTLTTRFRLDDVANWQGQRVEDQDEPLGPNVVMDIELTMPEGSDRATVNSIKCLVLTTGYCIDATQQPPRSAEELAGHGQGIAEGLITLLATRGLVKQTEENKLAKLGIGKPHKRRYRYTTTISLPERIEVDDEDHPPTEGKPKAPHIRRGHLRHQRFGPGLAFTKLLFIEATLVNADPGFVSTREAYNVLGPRR